MMIMMMSIHNLSRKRKDMRMILKNIMEVRVLRETVRLKRIYDSLRHGKCNHKKN